MTRKAEAMQRAFDQARAKRGLPPMLIADHHEAVRATREANARKSRDELVVELRDRFSDWLDEIDELDERPEINRLMHEVAGIMDCYEDSLDRIAQGEQA